jgi:hypothetical protein
VADVTDAVYRLPCQRSDIRIIPAAEILQSAPPETRREPLPWQWSAKVEDKDTTYRTINLNPDFVFGLDLPTIRKRYYFYVECDRATEPVHRATKDQSSVASKLAGYLAGRHAGLHTTRYGIGNLRFLITTTTRARIDTMLTALAAIAKGADTSMFFFAENDSLRTANHILDVPWLNSAGHRAALLPPVQPSAPRSLEPCLYQRTGTNRQPSTKTSTS